MADVEGMHPSSLPSSTGEAAQADRSTCDAGGVASSPDWLEPLIDRIDAAAGDPAELDSLFAELRAAHGGAEASRRWWAAFGATDASAT